MQIQQKLCHNAQLAFVLSKAKLSLCMVALLYSPLDTVLFLSLRAIHLLLPAKSDPSESVQSLLQLRLDTSEMLRGVLVIL